MRSFGDGDPGQRDNESDHNGEACGDCGARRALHCRSSRLLLHHRIEEDCNGKPRKARKVNPGTGLRTGAEKAGRRKLALHGKDFRNIHHGSEKVAARQDQERTRANNPELRNQKKPRNEIGEEGERKLDRCPGVGRLIVHCPKWDGDHPDSQKHNADHKRYSTFRRSRGQVRKDNFIRVIRLVQCSLPKPNFLFTIAPNSPQWYSTYTPPQLT
jgi:hypothetical protein